MLRAAPMLLGILIAALLLSGCEQHQRLPRLGEDEEPVLREAEGVRFTYYGAEAGSRWMLEADSVTQTVGHLYLREVEVRLYQDRELLSQGTAESAVLDQRTQDLHLHGDVRLESRREDITLSTSELRWNAAERRVQTDADVELRQGAFLTRGHGLVAEPDLSSVRISAAVTTYVNPDEEEDE